MLQWSRKRCHVGPLVQLAEHVVDLQQMSLQNATQVNLPKHWLLLASPPSLPDPPRSMLIYAHIFVDNSRDLIAHRAAANCYLVRQLICQKIDLEARIARLEAVWPVLSSLSSICCRGQTLDSFAGVATFTLTGCQIVVKSTFAVYLLQCPEV